MNRGDFKEFTYHCEGHKATDERVARMSGPERVLELDEDSLVVRFLQLSTDDVKILFS